MGAEDAEFLEKEFAPELTAEDLVNLGKYNIYTRLMVEGVATRPFSAETLLPSPPPPEKSRREKIINASRERYGLPRKIVEEKIGRWTTSPTTFISQVSKTPLYEAQCSLCQKLIKVPFLPEPGRKVYCKTCLKKVEEEKKEPAISLEEVKTLPPIPFSGKKVTPEKPKREKKEVNIKELKKVLEKALEKDEPR